MDILRRSHNQKSKAQNSQNHHQPRATMIPLLNNAFLRMLKSGQNKPDHIIYPRYNRNDLSPGILQIGVTNFHRSHLACYMEKLFNKQLNLDYAIMGAGVRKSNIEKREKILSQDCLSAVIMRNDDISEAQIIGAMIDHVPVELETNGVFHGPLKEALLNPQIKIVSLTITEGGYYLNCDGEVDKEHPDIKHDAANPENPKTVPGMIVQALHKRRDQGVPAFAVMSCDNVPHNGDVTKEAVTGLASMIDEKFAEWIESNVGFPNSMVDRITPKTTPEGLEYVKEHFGFEDSWPTFCEPFTHWVMEDKFPNGRPKLEEVGVQFVEDVTPYERRKIRILNGGHAILSYPASLMGIKYIHEAMEHPVLGSYLTTVETREVVPNLKPLDDMTLQEYVDITLKRFSNSIMKDSVSRQCTDGSNRQPRFILTSVKDCLSNLHPVYGLALVSAMWCRYCQGKTEAGEDIIGDDKNWDKLQETALKSKENPSAWLDMSNVYGRTGKNKIFRDDFVAALKSIEEKGVEGAMKEYIEKSKCNQPAGVSEPSQ